VDAKRRLEVGSLVKVVFEAFTKRVTVSPDKIRLHLRLADHSVPNRKTPLARSIHTRRWRQRQ